MRKFLISTVVVFLLIATTRAQDRESLVELFGGYSYLNFDLANGPLIGAGRQNGHGVGLNVAANLNERLGIVGDFSFNARDVAIPIFGGIKGEARNIYFLFGPRLSARSERRTVFGHVLVGAFIARDEFGRINKSTDVALGIGGGLDVNVSRTVAIRAFQLDYLPSRAAFGFNEEKAWLHNFRAQFGVVLKLGRK